SVANLAGAFVTTAVAKNIATGIIDANLATLQTLLAALFGAIAWNLLTWWFGLPSSSSHALIGGLIGAALAQSGAAGVEWHRGVPAARLPLLDLQVAKSRYRGAGVSTRTARLRDLGGVHARGERRAEDDGRDRARDRSPRQRRRRQPRDPELGQGLRRRRHRS